MLIKIVKYFFQVKVIPLVNGLELLQNIFAVLTHVYSLHDLSGGEYFTVENIIPAETVFLFILQTVLNEFLAHVGYRNIDREFERLGARHHHQIIHVLSIPRGFAK